MSPAPQLPLALRYPPDQRLETFVAPPPGVLAQLQALAGADGAAADWIYLAGPAGVGKTHLALATCAAAEAAGRGAAYVPLKAAAGRLHDALHAFDDRPVLAIRDVPEFDRVHRIETRFCDLGRMEQKIADHRRVAGVARKDRESGDMVHRQ